MKEKRNAIRLFPGNLGKDCRRNGEHFYKSGERIEICCDECDYLQCCIDPDYPQNCIGCFDGGCPRKKKSKNI